MEEQENEEKIITPEEIADDVQQTYEVVSNEYRKVMELRIDDMLKKIKSKINSDIKRIISHHFGKERNKNRIMNEEKNKELLNHLGSAFTVIETEVKADLRQYLIEEHDIFTIVPKRDFE